MFLRPHLPSLLPLMLSFAGSSAYSDSSRQMAIEVVVSCSETTTSTLRTTHMLPVVQQAVQLALSFLCKVEDDPQWGVSEDRWEAYIGA